jgi:D-3-phosphoglycerate dehydrogenase
MKVLHLDVERDLPRFHRELDEVLIANGLEVDRQEGCAREVILERGRDAEAFVTLVGVFDGEVMDQLPQCRVIVRGGIGVDTLDLAAATERGIVVANVPDYGTREVADHAWTLVLALWRKIFTADRSVKGGGWDWEPLFPVPSIWGHTLGIVGFGRIGREVARRGITFGMDVIAYDPYLGEDDVAGWAARLVDFETLLREADVISVNAPHTADNTHLFDSDAFEKMKSTAYFVNTGRGPICDTHALADAIRSGRITGAGLDVLESEPPPSDHPLLGLDNVILTPHYAGYSEEAMAYLAVKTAQGVLAVARGYLPESIINRGVRPKKPLAPYPGDGLWEA